MRTIGFAVVVVWLCVTAIGCSGSSTRPSGVLSQMYSGTLAPGTDTAGLPLGLSELPVGSYQIYPVALSSAGSMTVTVTFVSPSPPGSQFLEVFFGPLSSRCHSVGDFLSAMTVRGQTPLPAFLMQMEPADSYCVAVQNWTGIDESYTITITTD